MNILARCLIFLIFLLHPFMLKLADSECPQSSDCAFLGTLEFPFSVYTKPECGLFLVDCQDSQPRIKLGPQGIWYDVLQRISTYTFRVRDTDLRGQLNDKSACTFLGNRTLPDSPFSWSTISPALQIFSCSKFLFHYDRLEIDEYFKDYRNYSDCDAFMLYHKAPTNGNTTRESRRIPAKCVAFDLPLNPKNQDSLDLFQLVSVDYDLELNVSADCILCHYRGGKCRANGYDGFLCEVTSRKVLLIGGVAVTVLVPTFIFLFLVLRKFILLKLLILQKEMLDNERDIEFFLKNHGDLAPRRYKYSDLKKITKSFSENLGKGGYGSVYKGKLPDGRLVAVKILNESKGNGEEFMNEVASISRTSHINIVTLLGFCFEGSSKRALIYEFMPNGSLEKFIQKTASSSGTEVGLGWRKMFEIVVGVARGLEYLHRGCNMRIVHFDIKPHNILLDKDFNPRISDFGLAKLCPNRSSIVSMLVARGTIGYIAPEVFCRNFGGVSHKSDVYSYGMMVLEITGGKKNVDPRDVDRSSELYFPQYIYKQLEIMDAENLDGINEDESQFVMRKLLIVGLWCIQTDPKDRPSMNKVVDMLEGKIEPLHVPPKPFLSSPPISTPGSPTNSSISETM